MKAARELTFIVSAAPLPIVFILGPFDPSGSTGLPADAVTCAELGCHAVGALTGILVQDTATVEHFEPISPELLDDQARCLLEDMPAHAMKVGPLYTTETISVLAQITADYNQLPVVVHLQSQPGAIVEDELDAEETQAALFELVLPQTDLVVTDHTLLQQLQSHGVLPGQTTDHALSALLEYGASAVLVSGVPGSGKQRDYLLLDENGQTARWPVELSEPVIDGVGLLATAITCRLAQGCELAQAVEQGIAVVGAMAPRSFQPGMGGRIFNRSRS
ncbi:MAG TPA: bifunctional hydroxymethylpyrimidine kinase/phosphomethylpyrimidine kinase [Burkholderiaceae bacterium]|nr:bifunctional hydroxymethylpyrimidine kinase/phosphomethylpyrimidine kinase [Burkholderiaceae bacterium]